MATVLEDLIDSFRRTRYERDQARPGLPRVRLPFQPLREATQQRIEEWWAIHNDFPELSPLPGFLSTEWICRTLESTITRCQYILGIGAGASVEKSGEQAVFGLLGSVRDPVVFDVGANAGQFAESVLRSFRSGLSLHCFEPTSAAFAKLSRITDKRVTLNNVGLWSEPGRRTIHYDSEGSPLASLTKRDISQHNKTFDRSESVELTTLDTYCEEHDIDHIDLLKIDVEGHEMDVLAGARRLLEAGSIDLVTFEFGGCNIDTRTFFRDFWQLFHGLGMELHRLTPTGHLLPIKRYSERLEQFVTTNYLAVRPEHISPRS